MASITKSGTSTTPATTATTDTDTAPTTPTPTERPTKQTTNGERKSASFHVYVQLPSGTNRTNFGLNNLRIKLKDVDPDATIHSLKYQVEDMMGIPTKLQVLEFKDMALQNEKCLLDYGIDSGAILVCVGPNPKDKERVFSLVNVQISTRPLYLIGGGFYHTDNSEQSGGMCCGNKMLIEASDSILEIKKRIRKTFRKGQSWVSRSVTDARSLQLMLYNLDHENDGSKLYSTRNINNLQGVVLEDDHLVSNYSITNGVTLDVSFYDLPGGYVIPYVFVQLPAQVIAVPGIQRWNDLELDRCHKSRIIKIPFKTSDTIDSLKEAIEDIVGLPSCLQQLLLKNEELQNCYDIENETVVCIQLTTATTKHDVNTEN